MNLHNSQSFFRSSLCLHKLFIQVVHTEFINVIHTEYSTFKHLKKMSEKQVAATIIIALISKKNKSRKKKQKRKVWVKTKLKSSKT